jgi:hypothetical protein
VCKGLFEATFLMTGGSVTEDARLEDMMVTLISLSYRACPYWCSQYSVTHRLQQNHPIKLSDG